MENRSEQLNELFAALSKAQASILSAKKDSKNPFFKSTFADLSSVWDAIRKPLTENGLSIVQTCEGEPGKIYLETWLGHSSGQWMKSKIPLNPAKSDPQSMGSFITYMRRYSLSALVGVVSDEDDDGEAAMRRNHIDTNPCQNKPDANLKQNKEPEKPKVVTEDMAKELHDLLLQDKEFKDTVESFILQSLGKGSFEELSYADYMKILKRTKTHLEAKNDTTKSEKF